jgi:hypothetical protein
MPGKFPWRGKNISEKFIGGGDNKLGDFVDHNMDAVPLAGAALATGSEYGPIISIYSFSSKSSKPAISSSSSGAVFSNRGHTSMPWR